MHPDGEILASYWASVAASNILPGRTAGAMRLRLKHVRAGPAGGSRTRAAEGRHDGSEEGKEGAISSAFGSGGDSADEAWEPEPEVEEVELVKEEAEAEAEALPESVSTVAGKRASALRLVVVTGGPERRARVRWTEAEVATPPVGEGPADGTRARAGEARAGRMPRRRRLGTPPLTRVRSGGRRGRPPRAEAGRRRRVLQPLASACVSSSGSGRRRYGRCLHGRK